MPLDNVGFAVGGVLSGVASIVAMAWPVIAPLLGVVIGALIASQQQSRAMAFHLREAKLRRLNAAFQPVLLTAWAFSDATSPGSVQPREEEDEARRRMLAEAMTGLNQARAQIALEADAFALNETFEKLHAAYYLYALTLADTRAGDIPAAGQRLSEKRDAVVELVTKLERDMREMLAELERGVRKAR